MDRCQSVEDIEDGMYVLVCRTILLVGVLCSRLVKDSAVETESTHEDSEWHGCLGVEVSCGFLTVTDSSAGTSRGSVGCVVVNASKSGVELVNGFLKMLEEGLLVQC